MVGCRFCIILRQLLLVDDATDLHRWLDLARVGECYPTVEAASHVVIERGDEFSAFQILDRRTGALAAGTTPLWFKNSSMTIEGANEPPLGDVMVELR